MNSVLQSNKLKYFQCSNAACKKMFLINPKEVEHGNGIHLCSTCLAKSHTQHTIQCSNCNSIIDFLPIDDGEKVTTYFSNKCTCCSGSVDDEIHLSKSNSTEIFVHS